MTFEEYKKHFETFTKIDTPDVLEICTKQYQLHVLDLEDTDVFFPVEADSISAYEKNLYSILGFDKISKDQIAFLKQPAFEPESMLIVEKSNEDFSLNHIALVENYWNIYHAKKSSCKVDILSTKQQLQKDTGEKIFRIIETNIKKSRPPKVKRVVLDGTAYKFSKIVNGESVSIFKNSPSEDSQPGKIIRLFELLMETKSTGFDDEIIYSAINSIMTH